MEMLELATAGFVSVTGFVEAVEKFGDVLFGRRPDPQVNRQAVEYERRAAAAEAQVAELMRQQAENERKLEAMLQEVKRDTEHEAALKSLKQQEEFQRRLAQQREADSANFEKVIQCQERQLRDVQQQAAASADECRRRDREVADLRVQMAKSAEAIAELEQIKAAERRKKEEAIAKAAAEAKEREERAKKLGLDSKEFLHIAVAGPSGAGKSSLVNGLCGRRYGVDKDAAKVSIVQCTEDAKSYTVVGQPHVKYWDLPGCYTLKHPGGSYRLDQILDHFDAQILLWSTRFGEVECQIAKACQDQAIGLLFVRSKCDNDIRDLTHNAQPPISLAEAKAEVRMKATGEVHASLKQLGWKGRMPEVLYVSARAMQDSKMTEEFGMDENLLRLRIGQLCAASRGCQELSGQIKPI